MCGLFSPPLCTPSSIELVVRILTVRKGALYVCGSSVKAYFAFSDLLSLMRLDPIGSVVSVVVRCRRLRFPFVFLALLRL